ncbi:SET domain-containing protein [Poronia punctata]|nr:SET domain-containing protein [Poronia punctata]
MQSPGTFSPPRDLSSEPSIGAPADTFSNVASLSSTPPTMVADDASLASENPKDNNPVPITNWVNVPEPIVADEPSRSAESTFISELYAIHTVVTPSQPFEVPALAQAKASEPLPSTPASERSRRTRLSNPVYNLAQLAGTAVHGKRRAKGDIVSNRRRRTTSGATLATDANNKEAAESSDPRSIEKAGTIEAASATPATPVKDTIHASDSHSPVPVTKTPKSSKSKSARKQEEEEEEAVARRIATRRSGIEAETLTDKLSSLGKRGRKTLEKSVGKLSRELRRLQDTNEYSGIDTKPVLYTVWANGKYVDPSASEEPRPKRVKVQQDDSAYDVPEGEDEAVAVAEEPAPKKRRTKKWLDRGLYAGQEAPTDVFKGLTAVEKKKLAQLPELAATSDKPNKSLPAPMFQGLRMLIEGRDFKLPFDVCNPLPPGQPRPDEWRKMTRNRFVGDAGAYWKKTPHFKDYQSKCVCTPDDGCGETCQNRIMLYECDATNCNVGDRLCQNRAFARLQERTKLGGKFRVGVEVIKTSDRGYGIRANRCFDANQIIMEYTGEIITEEECDRRMNEKYKDNQCYYLMSFDQNMIIDATTGSIARFVNHSCQPNCRMVKWIVSGQPRMALFAGDHDIMTGEELTYDYNFDPFSSKNVQKCLCGSPNCRGVLGPKPKEVKAPKPSKEEATKAAKAAKTAKAAKDGPKGSSKRKLTETLDQEEDEGPTSSKKRKITTSAGIKALATGVKRTANLKTATKSAAAVIKRSVSSISVSTKAALGKKSKAKVPVKKTSKVTKARPAIKAKSTTLTIKGKGKATAAKKTVFRQTKLNIVAAGAESEMPNHDSPPPNATTPSIAAEASSGLGYDVPTSPERRKGMDVPRIRLVSSSRAD